MLTGGMYGNVQAALGFFVEYKDHLTNEMKLEQSLTDPCLYFEKDNQENLKLMALTHVDDTLIAGNEKEIKDFKKGILERFKFRDQGILQKHLGVTYEWKHDPKTGERLIEGTMKNLVDEIIKKYKQVMEREPTEYGTAGKPKVSLKRGAEEEKKFKEKGIQKRCGKIYVPCNKFFSGRCQCSKRFNKIFFLPNKISLEGIGKSDRTFKENEGHNKNNIQETEGAQDDAKRR